VDLSVIVATYNRAPFLGGTLRTLENLRCSSSLSWELLVVDNNSTDETRQVVEAFADRAPFCVRYLFERNQGRSAALNSGIAAARGRIVAFTDDDVLVDPEWLRNLKNAFDRFDAAAVAGKVIPLWTLPKPRWLEMEDQLAIVRFDQGEEAKIIAIPPLGANSAFLREMFSKYGSFRLDLGVSGEKHTITCDDTEFGERLIRGGEKIVYAPGAIVYHPVESSRMTKDYFLSWYYYNGRSLTRTFGVPQQGASYFGVPRWLYRELATNALNWFFCFNSERFAKKLKTYRSAGNLSESRRLSRLKSAGMIGVPFKKQLS
jgi:glucosyl-dolichyl phosphate glucuronosyltransferase